MSNYVLDCADFIGAVLMSSWMLSFAVCAFVGFAVALRGSVMFTAFGAYVMETSTCHGVMSKLLTFVALNQLKLRSVFLRGEPLLVDVDSMFDALVGHIWAGEENHEGEVTKVVLELSSQ